MSDILNILGLPDIALDKICSFLTYDEIAINRIVCKKFNEIGGKLLSRGFHQLEKQHAITYKQYKSLLPRRESERRAHPLARHCDILHALETRISMLNMTYSKYIENNVLCFIPGKVLDELKSVLYIVDSEETPPRTHQLMQELRDLSSMAMEHFDEHILPRVKDQMDRRSDHKPLVRALFSGSDRNPRQTQHMEYIAQFTNDIHHVQALSYGVTASCFMSPKILHAEHSLSSELHKVKAQSQNHKQHITGLTQSTQNLWKRLRRQSWQLQRQETRIRAQERKIQEQNTKIQEQEATLADIKKHIDEWDQKYTDLTTELVRARDDILSTTSHSPLNISTHTICPPRFYKSNIKPRMTHILPRSYMTLFDLDRKRKSNLLPEIPIKRIRTPEKDDKKQCNIQNKDDINLNIPDLIDFKTVKNKKDGESIEARGSRFARGDIGSMISSSLETLLKNPLTSIKSRKRKIPDEIDSK